MALDRGRKTIFEILSNIDPTQAGPRLGRLSLKGRDALDTPNFLAISSRGVVPHISPDVLTQHTQIGGIHVALEDFTERAGNGVPPILKAPGDSPIHAFASLPRSLITLLAPRRTPAVVAPVGNTSTGVSLFTSTGFQVVSNKAYINYVQVLRPDIAVALGDIPYGSVPGAKRKAKMGDRTTQWLSELLQGNDEEQVVFAPILPVTLQTQWEYLDRLADDLGVGIGGLALYDSSLLPDIPATTALTALPRLSLDEPSSPHHVLRQIALGMDIFTIPFIGFASDAGIALDFCFPTPLPEGRDTLNGMGTSVRSLGIDMWESQHATSLAPLSDSCVCYACTSHHRAFVQHLLSAKEMLGWVLLQVHNHHIMSTFFSAVRKSIKAGTFGSDCEAFARAYDSELPEKSGQGPRARGYHFKSEGPGEQKRNKAAWGNLGGDDHDLDSGLVPDQPATELDEKGFAEAVSKP